MRKDTEVENGKFPYSVYGNPGNCYFVVFKDGTVQCLGKNRGDLEHNLELMNKAKAGECTMYATWEGRWKTDMFMIENISEMIKQNIH